MSEQHTPTPWNYHNDEVMNQNGETIAHILSNQYDEHFDAWDARRIVACVNALEHISTAELETGAMQNLVQRCVNAEQQRGELLAGLKDCVKWIQPTTAQGGVHFESQEAIKKDYERFMGLIQKAEAIK